MSWNTEKLSGKISIYFIQLLWGFLCLFITRFIFFYHNTSDFQDVVVQDYLVASWFDIVTIGLVFLPYAFFFFFPGSFFSWKGYSLFLRFQYLLLIVFLLFFNLIDVEYFTYTKKRSTMDVFEMVQGGNDLSQQIASYFRDFWFVMLVFVFLVFITNKVFSFTFNRYKQTKSKLFPNIVMFLFFLSLHVIIGRGGLVLKPISPIDASQFTKVENAGFVLNTPFTIIKSWNKKGLEEKEFMSLEKELSLFNPIQTSNPQRLLPDNTNVVVLILESFGNEWLGAAGSNPSYTPFLDSLITKSLYFENGIANGKKSIEAVPAIFASIPSLLDQPYISSVYGNNTIEALPTVLKKKGYTSAFFHGATNGSMKFDGFAAQAGFDHYFGRTEYNNEAHYDKSWGILDEYFNPWTARQLSAIKQPFLASLFTLSSHHPFYIPPHMRGKLRKGKEPICEAIHYGDYSLKLFFEEAKKQAWFENTLFILCADHTASSTNPIFNQRAEMYKIPIIFYHPKGLLPHEKKRELIQQIDIYPTILDLLNLDTKFYSFGKSAFKNIENQCFNYIEGTYNYFKKDKVLTFSNGVARNLLCGNSRTKLAVDSLSFYKNESRKMEQRLKAIVQRYNRDLIRNQTTAHEKENMVHH
jgi:phosphoglycerol transferase MdoB-like AlkP superfamily enzyme